MNSLSVALETDRLLLRPMRQDDVDGLFTILGDAETMRFYPAPFTRDEVVAWIADQHDRYRRDGFGLLAMDLKETGETVGDCGPAMREVEGGPEIELAWHVNRELWGRGLAPEAAAACRDWAFDHAGPRLISLIRPKNRQSIRVAEKIGMRMERRLRYGSSGWVHPCVHDHPSHTPRRVKVRAGVLGEHPSPCTNQKTTWPTAGSRLPATAGRSGAPAVAC